MPGLTVLVVGADQSRAQAAMMTALAAAALGDRVQMFFHDEAVRLLAEDTVPLAALVREAIAADARIVACQTGLAAHGLAFDRLVDGCEAGGLVGVLSAGRDDRLLSF